MNYSSWLLGSALSICVLYIGFEYRRLAPLLAIRKEFLDKTKPYKSTPHISRFSILVLGDSTAYGIGASTPEFSVPGLLASLLDASVENCSHSGATIADLGGQLTEALEKYYDLVLIQAGANDIIRLKSLRASTRDMNLFLRAAKEYGKKVVLLTGGKIGEAPLFPWIFSHLLTTRSIVLRGHLQKLAAEHDVLYVDLFDVSASFKKDPRKYYSGDMLHLSDCGYDVWFNAVWTALLLKWPELFSEKRK